MQEYISVISLVVALVAVGVSWYLSKRPLDVTNVLGSIEAVAEQIPSIEAAAETAVLGIEQARREGKISDNNEAFNLAFKYIKQRFPDADEESIRFLINRFVLVASGLRAKTKGS